MMVRTGTRPPAAVAQQQAAAQPPAAAAPPPAATDQTPSFRSGVEVVTVDVGVIDRQGRPLRGLTVGDFSVTIAGKSRRVVTSEFIDRAAPAPAPPASAPAAPAPTAVST